MHSNEKYLSDLYALGPYILIVEALNFSMSLQSFSFELFIAKTFSKHISLLAIHIQFTLVHTTAVL